MPIKELVKVEPSPLVYPTVGRDGDTLVVHISKVGGNGSPSTALFMPVKNVADRCHLLISGKPTPPPYTVAQLFGEPPALAQAYLDPASPCPPYRFRLPAAEWPSGGDSVLMLLVFPQAPYIGESHSTRLSLALGGAATWAGLFDKVVTDEPEPKVGPLQAITDKLNECISNSDWGALDKGLMVAVIP